MVNNNITASKAVAPSRPPEGQRLAKPKRLKAHTVLSKSHSIPVVPRDKKGKPLLPLNVGIMTVISLGEVCKREHFHTERYIFPVGYEVTRYADPPLCFVPADGFSIYVGAIYQRSIPPQRLSITVRFWTEAMVPSFKSLLATIQQSQLLPVQQQARGRLL